MKKSKTPRERESKAFEELTELKGLLFSRTKAASDRYHQAVRLYGITDVITMCKYAHYSELYKLIEAAGYEEDYQFYIKEWKHRQEE